MYRLFYPCMLALLAIFVCFPMRSAAQQKNFSITPTPQWLAPYSPDLNKKADLRQISDGYYIHLFEEQYHAELKSEYRHVIRQIVSEAGVQNGAEISVNYDPAYERLQFHQVVVRRNGTAINQLSAGKFRFLQQEKELSRFIYSGLYTAWFIIDDVRKGDQIEFAYTLVGRNPIFEDKYFNTFDFGATEPVVNFYKGLIVSPTRKLQFKTFNNAPMPVKRTFQGMDLYEWTLLQVTNARKSSYSTPSWYYIYPFVQVSEYASWEEIVNWGVRLNTIPESVSPAVQTKVNTWLKQGGGDKTAFLQSAVRFVQDDIRYMGIEMGEYSHRPTAPEKIITRRFGDCKDKSLLLCTLLRAAGIEANVAYVDTDYKGKVAGYLPSPVMFDHTIVHAILDGKSYWIDPTINYQRGPVTAITIPDYQKALVIKKGNGAFSDIAQTQTGITRITETFTLPADNSKPGRLVVRSSYEGRYADQMRTDFAESSIKRLEQSYLDYYKDIYGDVTADTSLRFSDTDNGPDLFEVTEKYLLNDPWELDSTDNRTRQFAFRAKMLTDLLPVIETDTFNAPMALRYPYSLDYTLTFQMPEDWSFEYSNLHLKNEYYRVDFTSSVHGRTVKLHYQYTALQDHIPAAGLAAYRKDRSKIGENASFYLTWDGNAANAGSAGGLSGAMIVMALMFGGIFTYIAARYYKRSVLPIQHYQEPWHIGGFLYLLGFIIVTSPLGLLVSLFNDGLLNNSSWEAAIRAENSQARVLMLIAEVAYYVFLLVYSILLVMLFVKRRDTFPWACIVFYAALISLGVLDHALTGLLNRSFAWTNREASALTQAIILAAIWTPYLLKSERVKRTFVNPHPSMIE